MKSKRQPLTRQQVAKHLEEQVDLLISYCQLFDEGQTNMAKPIAACLRLLLHTTRSSKALLDQLGLRQRQWRSVVSIGELATQHSPCGLVAFSVEARSAEGPVFSVESMKVKSLPILRDPAIDGVRRVQFPEWWTRAVAINRKTGETFSRMELVAHVADTDGGAHVDPGIEPSYAAFREGDFLGVRAVVQPKMFGLSFSGAGGTPIPNAHLAAIRTIAHETLLTLQQHAGAAFSRPYAWARQG
jgi:hypothetical protein